MDNPQDLINQALGGNTPTTPTEPATQSLPTPEPLTQSEPTTNISNTPTPTTPLPDLNPTTTAPVEPVVPEALNIEAKGEDVPLSLVGADPLANSTNSVPDTEPVVAAPVIPTAPSTSQSEQTQDGKKKKSKIATAILVGLFALMGVVSLGGYYAYQRYGTASPGTIAQISTYTKEQCQGCSRPQDGGWLVWRDGQCKVSGTCNSTVNDNQNSTNPNAGTLNEADCVGAGKGYVWCSATDMNNVSYGFCNTTGVDGVAAKTCQNLAAEKGYSVLIGNVKCKCADATCTSWIADHENIDYYWDGGNGEPVDLDKLNAQKTAVTLQCATQYEKAKEVGFGEGSFICVLGKAGSGGVVYNGGQCTAQNGFPYNGGSCFCGTVQKDTTNGHTSYSSTCGCDKETTASPSPTASLMCASLTRTPTTVPKIGDNMVFSCAGTVVPADATKLSYSYRYQINGGAWQQMITDKSANPAARLTIATCGTYKVQCQVCGQIGGKQVCDPNWVAATQ